MTVVWDKWRLYCDNDACGQRTFAETGPVAERGARVSVTGRETMGHLVGDWLVPVRRVADAVGSSWHTATDAVGGVGVGKTLVVGPDDDGEGGVGVGSRRSRWSVSGPRPGVGVLGIDDTRRRVAHELRGRRGRATDPEYTIRGLLVRAEETLSPAARGKLLCTLADLGGDAGLAIGTAWRAKEHLRAVLALSRPAPGWRPAAPTSPGP